MASYIRPSRRDPSRYVWSTYKRDSLANANQDSLASTAGLRTEKPTKRAEKTAHDIAREFREKGLHLLGDM